MLEYNYSKGKSEVTNMYTMKYLEDTIDFILNTLSKVRIENLTAKGKYDILSITAEKCDIIFNAFKQFGHSTKDYKHKRIIFDDGTTLKMDELEDIEKKLLKVHFILIDMQKEILDIDDLMLEGKDAIERLKAEII
jgi:hypothetical protein